jgi:hypothetical protein
VSNLSKKLVNPFSLSTTAYLWWNPHHLVNNTPSIKSYTTYRTWGIMHIAARTCLNCVLRVSPWGSWSRRGHNHLRRITPLVCFRSKTLTKKPIAVYMISFPNPVLGLRFLVVNVVMHCGPQARVVLVASPVYRHGLLRWLAQGCPYGNGTR